MSRRKRGREESTTQFSVPAASLNRSLQTVTQYAPPRDRRSFKRKESKVPRPPSPTRPTDDPPEAPLPGPSIEDFAFPSFSAFPSAEDVQQYLDQTQDSEDEDAEAEPRERRFATLEHDSVLRAWTEEKGRFLNELLRLEGYRGYSSSTCPTCPAHRQGTPTYRCDDCWGGAVVCADCCREKHSCLPFHRVKTWNGQYFAKTTLKALGIVLQLGHPVGECCPAPALAPLAAMVIHTNGFHPVNLLFCGCSQLERAGDQIEQCMRSELYPASLTDPSTFCTFRALERFHVLTLQSKITAYDYYMSLQKLTDAPALDKQYDRLKPFLRMVREWRYLKLLKRAGRAHVEDGVENIAPGGLCLRCPACPRPGFNLPDNWETVPDDLKFIYTLVIAIDANFRLKRRAVSNDARDPGLVSGEGYFVGDAAYREHILQYADQEDISTCTGFAAMAHANTKFNRGYATTGVAMAVCARHGFILANGVGDLQKGERYCNMDYITMSALVVYGFLALLILSYDIACQWERHIRERLAHDRFPAHLRIALPDDAKLRFMIPKYHFWGHTGENHSQYSFNLVRGVGRTDGEEIERNWSRHDATAASTREMGPGSRHDTLEDHFQWANFCKLVNLGRSFAKKLRRALKGFAFHNRLWLQFSEGIDAADIDRWKAEVEAWEANMKRDDPYYLAPSGLTEAQIKAQLAAEEDKRAAMGNVSLHKVTPSTMVVELLEIEDLQRRFLLKYPVVTRETSTLVVDVVDRRAVIRRRIQAVREVQAVYMPTVARLVASHAQQPPNRQGSGPGPHANTSSTRPLDSDAPERVPLFLPNELDPADLAGSTDGLRDIEDRLREGQMRSAIDSLRVQLHVRSRLLTFKARNDRGQRQNQRSNDKIENCLAKIKLSAAKYRRARAAKVVLVGSGSWEDEWPVLKDADIRGLSEIEPQVDEDEEPVSQRRRTTQGTRTVSWIWLQTGWQQANTSAVPEMAEALRLEWLRARTRVMRFQEEIVYLREEQRRVPVSLEKNALEWDVRKLTSSARTTCPVLQQGLEAYAAEQGALQRGWAAHFVNIWKTGGQQTASSNDDGRELDLDACIRFSGGDVSDNEDGVVGGTAPGGDESDDD